MQKFLLRFLHFLYVLYAFLVFFITMILVVLGVAIATLLPEPTSGNVILRLCHCWAAVWYACIGLRHQEIYEAPHNRNASYVFLLNHQSYLDIPAAVYSMHQPVRILAKSEMAKIPLFGFIYRKAAILVDRSSAVARRKSMLDMRKTLSRFHLSVLVFPEGTFNETGKPLKDFYKGAFRVAIETQTNIKPIILPDTLDRMHYSSVFRLCPGRCRAVYLPEISVQGLTLADVEMLKEKTHQIMADAILRYRGK